MHQIDYEAFVGLLTAKMAPCISLYQPTHRSWPESRQDAIRFRNSIKHVEESLLKKYPRSDVRPLLQRLRSLADDESFWRFRTDALAVLAGPDRFYIFDLQRPVDELIVVADRFHIKPLLRTLQSADRFQVLCVSRDSVKLYEGNRDTLDEVQLIDVPSTLTDALGEELTEPHLTVASYGDGSSAPRGSHGEPAMYHGHGGRKDDREVDLERFFRVVDRGILEHHSRPSGLPLLLAALPEYHGKFHSNSHNPYLQEQGIERDPRALSVKELREEAWSIMEPLYLERLAGVVEDFNTARSHGAGSDDIAKVAEAGVNGRVGIALIDASRQIPGTIDRGTGRVRAASLDDPEVNDILDDLAQLVLTAKGEVIVVPPDRMPTDSGVAAIFRY